MLYFLRKIEKLLDYRHSNMIVYCKYDTQNVFLFNKMRNWLLSKLCMFYHEGTQYILIWLYAVRVTIFNFANMFHVLEHGEYVCMVKSHVEHIILFSLGKRIACMKNKTTQHAKLFKLVYIFVFFFWRWKVKSQHVDVPVANKIVADGRRIDVKTFKLNCSQ